MGDESDEVIPPDAERQFAQRMGADTIEVASGHAHDFVAEGDKVVVLTTRELEGEATEGADVLTFSPALAASSARGARWSSRRRTGLPAIVFDQSCGS